MANCKSRIDENGRECLRCKAYKLWEFFYDVRRNANKKDGTCIACRRELGKAQGDIEARDDPTALDRTLANSFLYARVKTDAKRS